MNRVILFYAVDVNFPKITELAKCNALLKLNANVD